MNFARYFSLIEKRSTENHSCPNPPPIRQSRRRMKGGGFPRRSQRQNHRATTARPTMCNKRVVLDLAGGADADRTRDLLNAIQAVCRILGRTLRRSPTPVAVDLSCTDSV